jgi:hypothetical protein
MGNPITIQAKEAAISSYEYGETKEKKALEKEAALVISAIIGALALIASIAAFELLPPVGALVTTIICFAAAIIAAVLAVIYGGRKREEQNSEELQVIEIKERNDMEDNLRSPQGADGQNNNEAAEPVPDLAVDHKDLAS